MSNKIMIPLEHTHEKPTYAYEDDAGADVRAVVLNEMGSVTLFHGESKVIKTGIKANIPQGYEIQVRPRSGLAAKYGITVLNAYFSRGVQDINVVVLNYGNAPFEVRHGDVIAQFVLAPVMQMEFV